MHRTARLVPILALAASGVLLQAGAAHGEQYQRPAVQPKPIKEEAADTKSEQRAVTKFWTPAKMEAAQPLDLPARKSSDMRLSSSRATEPTGRPVTIAPTGRSVQADTDTDAGTDTDGPARPAAARASSGSPWTRGGAVAKTAGRVFFTYQGRNASCSGSAVTSANKSVVITAGHCVKMGGEFHTNWVFVPGYDKGERPLGTWVATTLLTTPRWNSGEDMNHDVAAAVVAPLDGKALTDVVGGQGIAFNQARRQQMHSFGYPAAAPYDGSRLFYCSGRTFDDYLMSEDHGLTCDMTGGSSGGPWFTRFNETTGLGTLNSVNSFKYNFAPNWMFGPYFGSEAKALYDAAQRTDTM
ncbi:peptidase [Spongiactinospora sp. TRM90649]|uniref:trypsin-like serine peptidase n=1 Tax=Spongiactinospora sp. TRM90649 TaxID=3031114 RepID=UPI0023F77092|nr:peptidase [Spongiactinospora sp. TRM90649]MDF5753945.1 peptidase [Spongiactinospora sp. TRM90649]